MKNFKKIASAIAALSLAACMVAPVATMTSFADGEKGSIVIANPTGVKHTYEAYQIFDGDLTTEGTDSVKYVLSNITWGTGVNPEDLVSALKGDATFEYNKPNVDTAGTTVTTGENPFSGIANYSATADTSAKEVAAILPTLTENGLRDFLKIVGANLETVASTATSATSETPGAATFSELDPGYYFIKDKDDSLKDGGTALDDAYTRYMVQVLGEVETINPKSAKPTVDKQVFDDDVKDTSDVTKGSDAESDANPTAIDNGSGWGETADHAINESFEFKLKATLTADPDYDEYETYTVQFSDVMSKGVTYEKVETVTIYWGSSDTSGTTVPASSGDNGGYVVNTSALTEGKGDGSSAWTIKIPDIKKFADSHKLSEGAKIEVVYKAHLNEDATAATTSNVDTDNENKVKLQYSNNPNTSGSSDFDTNHGETPEDSVWVFTYESDHSKVDGEGTAVKGAEFNLFKGSGESLGAPLKFYKSGDYYYLYDATINTDKVSDASEKIEANGGDSQNEFKFKGLDAGTYTLKETVTPNGYNTCDPVVITITANHQEYAEVTDSKKNIVTFTASDNMNANIVNQKGASLPSTGGIGTTLFYLGGGALVAVAGVMLITKKRMTKE